MATEMGSQFPRGSLQSLLDTLSRHNVDYVVCGGIACILHGVDRVTRDIDLSVRLDGRNLAEFVDVMARLEFRPRLPEPLVNLLDAERRRAWIDEKGAKVFTLESDGHPFQVDVFLDYPIKHDDLRESAIVKTIGTAKVRISSIPHLIQAKQAVLEKRKIDLRDIEDLSEILKRGR